MNLSYFERNRQGLLTGGYDGTPSWCLVAGSPGHEQCTPAEYPGQPTRRDHLPPTKPKAEQVIDYCHALGLKPTAWQRLLIRQWFPTPTEPRSESPNSSEQGSEHPKP